MTGEEHSYTQEERIEQAGRRKGKVSFSPATVVVAATAAAAAAAALTAVTTAVTLQSKEKEWRASLYKMKEAS